MQADARHGESQSHQAGRHSRIHGRNNHTSLGQISKGSLPIVDIHNLFAVTSLSAGLLRAGIGLRCGVLRTGAQGSGLLRDLYLRGKRGGGRRRGPGISVIVITIGAQPVVVVGDNHGLAAAGRHLCDVPFLLSTTV